MLHKRHNWVLLRRRDVGVDGDPRAQEYSRKATPKNVRDSPAVRKVGTTI